MSERTLSITLWVLGIATILIVAFALVAAIVRADAMTSTLPRVGWVPALVGWGVGAGTVLVAVGRAVRDEWPPRVAVGIGMLAVSVVAAVTVEMTVTRWASARFGAQAADPDLIGWSTGLSPMIVLVGLATLAATVLPGPGRTAARALTAVAAFGVLVVVASNVPGAFDGITPLGVPMGLAMAAAAAVALVAAIVAVRPVRSRQEPER